MKEKIVFFGSGPQAIPVLKTLLNYNLLLVVTTEREGKLHDFLNKNDIKHVVSDLKDAESRRLVRESYPGVGILASYGAIVPQKVIELFPFGILNIHPSLLPKFKGASPIQSAILSGTKTTGVTIIKLDDKVDHGPIIAQKKYTLTGIETTRDLKIILFSMGAELIEKVLDLIEKGEKIPEYQQEHSKGSMTQKITKEDGFINLNNPPDPARLDRMIRAYHPWPGVYFKTVLINKIRLVKLLPSGMIQVEGKNPMSYKDFVNGYQEEGRIIIEKLGVKI